MPSELKYIDHAHDVLGMDRSASPNIAPQGKWFTCQDVRFRDLRIETFPAITPTITDSRVQQMDHFEISNEGTECLCWFNVIGGYWSPSDDPTNIRTATIINRVGTWPPDGSQNYNLCSLKFVPFLGFNTTQIVQLTVGAGNTITCYVGSTNIGTQPIAATVYFSFNSVTVGFGFVPSNTTGAFDNFVTGTNFYFQQTSAFNNQTQENTLLRPQSVKWGTSTYIVRGSQLYKRINGVYIPLMYGVMSSQNFTSARYCEVFQRHLILAGGTNNSSVFWSGLNDLDDFLPTLFNESDVYPILRFNHVNVSNYLITGLKNLGVYCYVYTTETIWRMVYVGLPKVMFLQEVSTSVGSQFLYGLVDASKEHFFISASNFHMFDGNSVTNIGDPIKLFFFADINPDRNLQKSLWGYYNYRSEEIIWFYVSTRSMGAIDRALYYHIPTKSWYYRNVPDVRWVYDAYFSEDLVQVQGANQPLAGDLFYQCNSLGLGQDVLPAQETTTLVNWSAQNPILESNDFVYNAAEDYKDVNSVYIDSNYPGNIGFFYSIRQYINSVVSYVFGEFWNQNTPNGRIGVPKVGGRCFRYLFQFQPTGTIVPRARLFTYGENVFVKQAEQ